MKREIRDRRKTLMKESIRLKSFRFDDGIKNRKKIDELQDETFKKFKFYDGLIKAMEGDKEDEKSDYRRSK